MDCMSCFDLESCSCTVSRFAARCRIAPVLAYFHSIQPRYSLQLFVGLWGRLGMLNNEAAARVETVVRDSCFQGYL